MLVTTLTAASDLGLTTRTRPLRTAVHHCLIRTSTSSLVLRSSHTLALLGRLSNLCSTITHRSHCPIYHPHTVVAFP